MSRKTLPKASYLKPESSIPRGQEGGDIFPRNDHPDKRSNATWLKQLADRMRERHPKESRWYPDKKRGGAMPGAGRPTDNERLMRKIKSVL